MICINEVRNVLEKHDLSINLPEGATTVYNVEEKLDWLYPVKNDMYFLKKYEKHVPQGWYGFAIGTPIPKNWMDALDEILELLIKCDPELEIHQIKLKYGGMRFYVISKVIEDLFDIELMIEDSMFNKALIY